MPHPRQSLSRSTDFLAWLQTLGEQGPLAVAFSGGLDSRFLCHMALRAGITVLALHAQGPHIARSESLWAYEWAHRVGLSLHTVHFQSLSLEGVRDNSPQRCYACKQALIRCLRAALTDTMSTQQAWILCDGTNADDLQAHRPGLRALQEAGIRSPLAECGISKAHIRQWAQETGLENPEQKARPCLLTRLAYGMHPTPMILERIATLEEALAHAGLQEFRLRLTPAPLLQSVPLTGEQRRTAHALLHQHGFGNADILEESSIGGFFDR